MIVCMICALIMSQRTPHPSTWARHNASHLPEPAITNLICIGSHHRPPTNWVLPNHPHRRWSSLSYTKLAQNNWICLICIPVISKALKTWGYISSLILRMIKYRLNQCQSANQNMRSLFQTDHMLFAAPYLTVDHQARHFVSHEQNHVPKIEQFVRCFGLNIKNHNKLTALMRELSCFQCINDTSTMWIELTSILELRLPWDSLPDLLPNAQQCSWSTNTPLPRALLEHRHALLKHPCASTCILRSKLITMLAPNLALTVLSTLQTELCKPNRSKHDLLQTLLFIFSSFLMPLHHIIN